MAKKFLALAIGVLVCVVYLFFNFGCDKIIKQKAKEGNQKAYKKSVSKLWKASVSEYNALYNQIISLGGEMQDVEKLKHILKVQLKSLDALEPISEIPKNQEEFNRLLMKTLETQKVYYQKILEVLSLTEGTKEKLSSVALLGKELEDLYERCKEKMPELYPEISERSYIAINEKLTQMVNKFMAEAQKEKIIIVEKEKPGRKIYVGEFLCPDCDKRKLTEYDLSGKSAKELTLMRNEIYAKHGRYFKRKEIREYFESQPWYSVNPDYSNNMLNSSERYNVIFIREYQEKYGLEY